MIENIKNYNYSLYSKQFTNIAGVDEVGRGPLAGDVIAAAVILPENYHIDYLTDSKKLTEKKRLLVYEQIKQQAVSYAIGRCSPKEIDEFNIFQASLIAMQRAVVNLSKLPGFVLIDGKFCPKNLAMPSLAVIKGDLCEDVISAASIIAKVTRDTEMLELDSKYPGYGFAKHKGYPTKDHIDAMKKQGVSDIHRKSFAPVRSFLVN